MSSDSSVSSGSRIRQFGLYRTIDARTEEFLRLSRKRQIRQGCACAAASTAITVTVLIVILLIYEYAIAVEWSLVQKRGGVNGTNDVTNITNDSPFADRLDRSYFGFDQDYFERMPLLVNALQESNYNDPLLEMSRPLSKKRYNKSITTMRPILTTETYKQNKIRRTSPRPFIFEYRSPTPLPFSKKYGSRSWVDSYRNAQRLQNIRQVIKYLDKTIHAKIGDMYTKPSSSHTSIGFSGVYVEPMVDKDHNSGSKLHESDMQEQGSDKVEFIHRNYQSDPYFKFKPDSPGDVNLLADGLWRFSPILTPSNTDDKVSHIPMFKRISNNRKFCPNGQCNENVHDSDGNIDELLQSSTEQSTEIPSPKPKSFSVMLNVYPFKPNPSSEFKVPDVQPQTPVEKIYLTTSKPIRFQFRQKTTLPVRRTYYRYKKPKYLIRKKNEMEEKQEIRNSEKTTQRPNFDEATKMIVHVNVYSPEDKTDMRKKTNTAPEPFTTTTHSSTFTPITETPFELSSGQVEEFHDGSSGVIPVHERTEPPQPILPQVTTIPFFDTDTASSEINLWATTPLDVVKFSAEDAKVPDHYINFMDTTTYAPTEINRRTSVDSLQNDHETLIIRLKNDITSTTTTEVEETTTEKIEETTSKMYVPQTNGHYRSFGSKNSLNLEKTRKKRIEMSVSGLRTYVPMYVEIKRNNTQTSMEDE